MTKRSLHLRDIILLALIGIIFGVIVMIICDNIVKRKHTRRSNNSLLDTGIIVGIGLALHNFPEGLAIGSGFGASIKLRIFISCCYTPS